MNNKFFQYAQELRKRATELLALAELLETDLNGKNLPPTITDEVEQKQPLLSTIPADGNEGGGESTPDDESREYHTTVLPHGQYQTCYIHLPNQAKPLPAVLINNQCYSLVAVVADLNKALAVTVKLEKSGEQTVITETGKGYGIWVWQPQAFLDRSLEEGCSDDHSDSVGSPIVKKGRTGVPMRLVSTSASQTESDLTLAQYLSALNRLSELAHQQLGTAVVVHYWEATRPTVGWLEKFEVIPSGEIVFSGEINRILNAKQQQHLQQWVQRFIERCRRIIRDFPQTLLTEDTRDRLVTKVVLQVHASAVQ